MNRVTRMNRRNTIKKSWITRCFLGSSGTELIPCEIDDDDYMSSWGFSLINVRYDKDK